MRPTILQHAENNNPKAPFVKTLLRKCSATTLFLCALGLPFAAQATTLEARTIRSTQSMMNMLHAVVPEHIPRVIQRISEGSVRIPAPENPIWILEAETGSILYYQGQPGFTGAHASRLVDDEGFRFGAKALEFTAHDKSGWLQLKLGGETYRAHCDARFPFAVCSLVGSPRQGRFASGTE